MLLQPAKSHVRKILAPFEIGDRNSAGVQEDVGNDQDPSFMQALFSTGRGRPISGLGENLALDTVAVFQRYLVFESCRNQDVTRNVPDRTRAGECFGIRKILYRSGFFPEIVQLLDRNSV